MTQSVKEAILTLNLIWKVNTELTKMARWFKANKMAVNVDESKLILFHKKDKQFDPNKVRKYFND
jgi:hypothetical protein